MVAGNAPVDQGVQNALYTLELCEQSIPVHRGMPGPLTRPLETAQFVHGQDGMGDVGLPIDGCSPASSDAIGVILRTIHHFPGQLTLVMLGPLTNLAVTLRQDPTIAQLVSECVIMGGTGRGRGNITPVSEYNFWADPEAASIVFESGLPIKMIGWDISRKYAFFNPHDIDALRAIGTPLAHFCVDIQKTLHQFALTTTKLPGFDLPDPIAMAVALDPLVATHSEHLYVAIETQSSLCRGQSVVDHVHVLRRQPNAEVVREASRERFMDILYAAVS